MYRLLFLLKEPFSRRLEALQRGVPVTQVSCRWCRTQGRQSQPYGFHPTEPTTLPQAGAPFNAVASSHLSRGSTCLGQQALDTLNASVRKIHSWGRPLTYSFFKTLPQGCKLPQVSWPWFSQTTLEMWVWFLFSSR